MSQRARCARHECVFRLIGPCTTEQEDRVHLSRHSTHTVWDNSLEPVGVLAPGGEITVEVANSSGGQLERTSTAAELETLDFARVNPVTGPIWVEGAEPGDALVVEVLDIDVEDWGWTANIPGFGLLSDQFPEAHLRISRVEGNEVELLPGLRIHRVPMIGTIGLAPAEPGELPMVPPHRNGGNMDIRHVTAGARLWLPVAVEGAKLSLGDTHAAQGDGEVCGTGVETGSTVLLRVSVEPQRGLATPMLETDESSQRTGPALVTTGIGPDLRRAAREATSHLIDEVVRRTKLDPVDAYLLASVAADMHVSEIVDLPNVVVSMHLAIDLLGGSS